MSSETVTDEEKHLIDEHFRVHFPEEVPQSYHKVTEVKAKKKIFGSNTSKRILVVSTYHIFLFRNKTNELSRNVHYYDVKEIETDDSHHQLNFKVKPHDLKTTKLLSPSPSITDTPSSPESVPTSPRTPREPPVIPAELPATPMIIQSSTYLSILSDIRTCYQKLSYFFPEEHKILIKTPSSNLSPIENAPDAGKAKGFFHIYKAWCHYYQTTPNSEFQHHLEDLVDKNEIDLDLSEVVGIEPKSEISLDLAPITGALRFNTYFRSFQLRNASRREVVSQIAEVMLTNNTITKLVLVHVDGDEKSYMELGNALSVNKDHLLQYLHISDKGFGTKAAISLGEAFAQFTHALPYLDLSGCSIQPKGVTALFAGLEQNYPMSLTVHTLNLSGNTFDKHGSVAINLWMREPKSYLHLERLQLANTTLCLPIVDIFKTLHRLTEIDFSGVKVDNGEGCVAVAYLCEQNEGLKKLKLSNCGLAKESFEAIHEAVIGNAILKKIEYDISYNPELSRSISYLAGTLAKATCFSSINLSGVKMKEENVAELVIALSKTKGLEKLYLNHVLSRNAITKEAPALLSAFQTLLTSTVNSLRVLEISHGFGRSFVLPLVEVIKPHFTLQILNIGGNQLGDKGADVLAGLFRYNTHLLSVDIDDNKLSASGFSALGSAIIHNKSLVKLQFVEDFEKAVTSVDDIPKKMALYNISATIHKLLEENERTTHGLNTLDQLMRVEHPVTPTTVAPLGEMPEFLKQHSTVISFQNVPEFVAQHNARKYSVAELPRMASSSSTSSATKPETATSEESTEISNS